MDEMNHQDDTTMAFDPDMAEILESFIIESKEILDRLGGELMQLERRSTDADLQNTIFREVHTLKGTSSFLGFAQFTELSHHFEDLLNAVRKSEIKVTPSHIDYSLVVYDMLKEMMDDIETRTIKKYQLDDAFSTLKELSDPNSAVNGGAAPSANTSDVTMDQHTEVVEKSESSEEEQRARDMAEAMQSLQSIINSKSLPSSMEAETSAPLTMDVTSNVISIPEPVVASSPIQRVADKELQPAPSKISSSSSDVSKEANTAAASKSNVETTIRVDVQRLDSLMNLVGELVLGRNRFAQLIHSLNSEDDTNPLVKELLETSTHIDYITTELQAAVMKTRMVSMSKIYNKLPRLVRDLCKETNKEIDLLTFGEETELDKTLVEELNDPFIHLLRNAADHGVETPDEREAKGKPLKGSITVRAVHAGNHIAISISDDGKGMDPEILKRVAISRGVITEAEAEHMSDQEAFRLIFMPGFSTAKQITNVSGRGVGMDVVKTNILKLKGSISIESTLNVGSVFTIKLPLTLAIIQALLVEVKNEIYSIPLESVIEVIRLNNDDIQTIRSREAMLLRGSVLPLIRLESVLGNNSSAASVSGTSEQTMYTVVLQVGEQKVGVIVENLLGQREIVIKTLGETFEGVRGVSGSTILGDGRVIMIIDVPEILKLCSETMKELA